MSALLDLVALSLLPLRWYRDILSLLRSSHPPTEVLDQFSSRRQRHGGDTGCVASPDALRARAERAIDRARRSGIDVIAWSDPEYPSALAAIVDPPPVLWIRGTRAALEAPGVAVVGSRAGSAYALAVAERLAVDLAARGLTIISGLARGVDSAAHRGALAAPGSTIAVLGSGADIIYPREHIPLATRIIAATAHGAMGAIVSELVPGTPPRPDFFPRRNRIISGLARAVVVIEAGEKSGSLITARCALEQGRDVLAVPGNVLNGRNRGSHALLRDGAKIVEGADDILEELGLDGGAGHVRTKGSYDPVLACLFPGEPCDLDAIAERTGLTAARLLPRLLELELQGLVQRIGGGRFVRFDRPC
jgi:DNA processing protein